MVADRTLRTGQWIAAGVTGTAGTASLVFGEPLIGLVLLGSLPAALVFALAEMIRSDPLAHRNP